MPVIAEMLVKEQLQNFGSISWRACGNTANIEPRDTEHPIRDIFEWPSRILKIVSIIIYGT